MPLRFGWLFLLLLTPLGVTPLAVQAIAQPPDKPLYAPSLIGSGDNALAGITPATVPKVPFSATVSIENKTVSRGGKVHVEHLTGEVARNSCGSTRSVVDINDRDAPIEPTAITIHIYDAARKADITVFPAAKSAIYRPEGAGAKVRYPLQPRLKQPPIERRLLPLPPPGQPFPTVQTQREDLRSRIIEGRQLGHGRETTTFPAFLTPNKRALTTASDRNTQTVALRDIRRQNPDPSLFQIPPDYQVTQVNIDQSLNQGFCPLP